MLVLLSGSGRTLVNLIEHIEAGTLDARVAGVIASRSCVGIDRAREYGVPAKTVAGEIPADELDARARDAGADLIVCAGYLRYVNVPTAWRGRIVNIHPALLPDFGGQGMYGDKVHRAVLEAARAGRVSESGCTVHLVDEVYDHGEILLQRRCPVREDDTVETLGARVFELEKQAYPEGIGVLIARNAERGQASNG